jgi:putative ABC transport system permease protein
MLYNYFKVTLRNIWRSKVNSIINILGLAVGIACAILIVLFVKDEVTFDQFHSKIDRLFRVTTTMSRDGDGNPGGMTPFVVGLTVKDEIQDVESAIVLTSYNDMVEHGEAKFRELITIVGSDFFNMFDFKVLDGSTVGALDKITDLVLTREIAEKYFGRVNIAGENLSINAGGELKEYLVTAVIENVPSNSSLQFDLLVSDDNLKFLFQERQLNHWFMIAGEVYVLLREGSTKEGTEAKFPDMIKKGLGEERYGQMQYENGLQPMGDIHLGPQMNSLAPISDPKYTMILSAIAALILLIASINFITISLAKSINRSREIGVRKSIGALKTQLIWQFLLESTVLAFIALFLGLVLVWFTLPLFNELAQKRLEYDLTGWNSLMFVGLTFFVALLAGFYPAIVISGYKPTHILKGEVKVGSGKQSLRVIMVAAQFIVTIFMITSTLIMKKQIDFMQNTSLGFDKEQLLMVPLNVSSSGGEVQQLVDGMEKGKRLKLMLDQEPILSSVSITSLSFGPGSWININFNDEKDEERDFFYNTIEPNYITTLGMNIVAGRDFEKDNEADKRRSIIVNEAFVKEYGFEDPIGERIPNEEFVDHEIIGVVQDFNFASLHMPVEPLILAMNPEIAFSGAHGINLNSDPTPKVAIRLDPNNLESALPLIEEKWNEAYPGEPFDYHFVDQQLENQYAAEQNLGKLVTSAAILAILIGSMGLFALAMLTMNARLKEMSIRKVLGASNTSIAYILSRSYLLLVLIALIISIPLSYQVMSSWLTDFAFKTTIGADTFILAGAISLLIAWLAISYHSIKMAINNPVEGLRSE